MFKDIIKNLSCERFKEAKKIYAFAYTFGEINFMLYDTYIKKLESIENIENLYNKDIIKKIFIKSTNLKAKEKINYVKICIKKDSKETYDKYFNSFRQTENIDINTDKLTDEIPQECIKYDNYSDTNGFLLPLPIFNISFMGVISHLGSGKTHQTKDYIEKYYKNKRVLIITGRVSLAQEFAKRFGDFTMYKDVKGAINASKLIIQMDSLFRLFREGGGVYKYDLVILDETELLLNRICEVTTEKRQVLKYFEFAISKSNVIALDGHLTNTSKILLENIRGQKMTIVRNNKINDKYKMVIDYDYDNSINEMMKDIKNKKKLFIVCNEKMRAETLKKIIGDKYKVSVLTSDTCQYERASAFADLNNYVLNYDVLIVTSVLLAGNSIDIKHFDRCYIYTSSTTNNPSEIHQMAKRVRNLNDKYVHCCLIKMSSYEYITTHENVRKWAMFMQNYKAFPLKYNDVFDYMQWDENGKPEYNKNLSYLLNVRYKYNSVNSRTCFFSWFYHLAKQKYDISFLEKEEPKYEKINHKKIIKEIKTEKAKDIKNSRDITEEKYEFNKTQAYLNKDEMNENKKFLMSKTYDINYDDEIFQETENIIKLMNPTIQEKYKNLKFISHTVDTFDDFINDTMNKISEEYVKYDNTSVEYKTRYKYIVPLNNVIKLLGYDNLMDTSKILKRETIEENYNINKKEIIQEMNIMDFIKNASSKSQNYDTWKKFISALRTYTDMYGLNVKNVNENTKRTEYHKFKIVPTFDIILPDKIKYEKI